VCPELEDAKKGNVVSDALPYLKNIIIISDDQNAYSYTWQEIMKQGKAVSSAALEERKQTLDPDDVTNMQYTSGTTGFPKGVMLTHHNIVNNGNQIADCMKLTNNDRVCIPVPFFHCFGCLRGILDAVLIGATMVLLEQFDAEKVLQA